VHYTILLYSTILYCTVHYTTVLFYTVLYTTLLYCTVLYCTVRIRRECVSGESVYQKSQCFCPLTYTLWCSFRSFASSHPLAELRTAEENAVAEAENEATRQAAAAAQAKAAEAAAAAAAAAEAAAAVKAEAEAAKAAAGTWKRPRGGSPWCTQTAPRLRGRVHRRLVHQRGTSGAFTCGGESSGGSGGCGCGSSCGCCRPSPKTEEQQLADYLAVRDTLYRLAKERDAKIREFEMLIREALLSCEAGGRGAARQLAPVPGLY